jgi:hypothetical protein
MTPATTLVCPSNLWQGFIARFSSVTAAGKDIAFLGIATTTTPFQLWSATIYAITHQEIAYWDPILETRREWRVQNDLKLRRP